MRRVLVWLLAACTVAFGTAWLVAYLDYAELMLPLGPAELLSMAVGGFLIVKGKGTLIGPVLLIGGSAGLIYDLGTVYASVSLDGASLPWDHVAAWLGAWTGPFAFILIPMLLVLFPDGSFRGGRRWWMPVFTFVVGATLLGALLMWQVPTSDLLALGGVEDREIEYPGYELINIGFLSWLLIVPASLTLVYRYWRSSPGTRQQIKWLLAAALIVTPLSFLASWLGVDPYPILAVAPCAAPMAVAIAVLRYRLYDLDRIVSRTVTYTLVIAFLALGIGLVATIPATQFEDPLLVAATTLAVAAVFNPLRKRVQGWVDRRFNRSRYDAERVMDQFAGSLRDRIDPDGMVDGWVEVVSETMQPLSVGVWVRE